MKEPGFLKSVRKGTEETCRGVLKKQAGLKRWKVAQDSEVDFWEGYTTENIQGDFEGKARHLLNEWKRFIKIDKNTKILQIGCGPKDVINFFDKGQRYSIDPLAEFYKKTFDIDYKSSRLQEGVGEKIPFKDNFFDIVILANVLDHVHSPEQTLNEIKRVLKKDGIFHFENFVYQKRFIRLAKIWGKIKEIFSGEIFNIHHPYMFTVKDLQILLSKKFSFAFEEIGPDYLGGINNFEDLKRQKTTSKRLTTKIPALFGLYGIINYKVICKGRQIF